MILLYTPDLLLFTPDLLIRFSEYKIGFEPCFTEDKVKTDFDDRTGVHNDHFRNYMVLMNNIADSDNCNEDTFCNH